MKRYKVPVLGLRMVRERTLTLAGHRVRHVEDAAEVAHRLIGKMPQEHLVAILVDGLGNITGIARLAIGGMHGTVLAPADVLRAVLAHHATAFVLSHNHPSGDPRPSHDDERFTRAIAEAAKVVGLTLLDHVIVTRDPVKHSSHRGEV